MCSPTFTFKAEMMIFKFLFNVGCFQFLLGSESEPPTVDLNDLLLAATLEGDVEEILSLVQRGANPNIMLALQTPLVSVCHTGNIEAAKELIRMGADPNFGDSSYYPLLVAIENCNIELVRALIEAGCSSLNHEATLLAVYKGPFEIVKLLVEHFGFDVEKHETALQVEMLLIESCQRGNPTIMEYIMQHIPESLVHMGLKWAVHEICFHWFNDQIWAVLAASGWLKDLVNGLGEPVLVYALTKSMEYHAARLIRNGANVTQCDFYGNQALHVVKSEGLVGTLIAAGADLEAVNYKGQTPLIAALEEQRWTVARALIKHGANPNAIDNIGCKPLVMSIPIVTSMNDRASVFMSLLRHPKLDLNAVAQEAIRAVITISDLGLRNTGYASIMQSELDFRRSFVLLFCGNRFDADCCLSSCFIPFEVVQIIIFNLLMLNRLK